MTISDVIAVIFAIIFVVFIFVIVIAFLSILGAHLIEWFEDWVDDVFSNF